MLTHDARDGIDVQASLCRQRNDIEKVHLAAQPLKMRQQVSLFLHVVNFIDREDDRRFAVT